MKISCRVTLFLRGGGPTAWIPCGFQKTGNQEWDVVTEAGETIGRCWGRPDARMFSFGADGHTGFHLERLPEAKQWDVEIASRERSQANITDFPLAPPDDEAQPRREGGRAEAERRRAYARLGETIGESIRRKKAEKMKALREKLEREAPP